MLPNIAVILTDAQRKILWVNEDFTEITGYTLTEVAGKKPNLLQGPETEQEAIKRIRRNLQHNIAFREEITNYRKNGEAYLCKLVIHPVFNRNQQLSNFIAFEVDGGAVKNIDDIPLMQLQEKYSSSSLKGAEEFKLFFKAQSLMEKDKLFLNPNLSLKEVADRLHTNTKYLSQVVNHHTGSNFQHFINTYRVKEVKENLSNDEYQNLTLFGIALQSGFKNKSTFYKVFKEISGQTPKEFIKMARI
ncbi:MAG: helix-turn-helix domain-containing protein [Phaeodactylibacter sp.]|nr:helix-turn-helix domain-containing protein [Phaeodactylibacter sp.]